MQKLTTLFRTNKSSESMLDAVKLAPFALFCALVGLGIGMVSFGRKAPAVPPEVKPVAYTDEDMFEDIEPVNGDAEIRGMFANSPIILKTTTRVAGAVDSIVWNGKEFIDSTDHGRQMQSASNFQVDDKFIPETYNPTEAGSMADGIGPKSTSQLRFLEARKGYLKTQVRMAYWLSPKEQSAGHPAKNTKVLSDHVVQKVITIGYRHWDNVIPVQVRFNFPVKKEYRMGQFEYLTGYMPEEFGTYWKFDPKEGKLLPLSDGPGEQECPVVMATESGSHAMGIFYPTDEYNSLFKVGFGRFRFPQEKVNKWNVVGRNTAEPNEILSISRGLAFLHCFVVIGTLQDVENTMRELTDYCKYRRQANWSYLDRDPANESKTRYMGTDRSPPAREPSKGP